MFPNAPAISRKEKTVFYFGLFLLAVSAVALRQGPSSWIFPANQPLRPLGPDVLETRNRLKDRLLLAAIEADMDAALQAPGFGHLEPKGKMNPDGSEVWGYPDGSGLEGVIEVHVRDGRIVREVLRPSAQPSSEAIVGALSENR